MQSSASFLTQVPEGTGETHVCQKRLGFLQRVPPPLRLDLVLIPPVRESPALFRGERGSGLQVTGLAPTINVLFRPEEEHGASGESYVVPPVVRRNGEMDDSFAVHKFATSNFESQSLAAIAAGCSDHRISPERGGNTQRVPNADPPVGLPPRLDAEARGYGAKRVRRPNVAIVRGENQHFACSQALQGFLNLGPATS